MPFFVPVLIPIRDTEEAVQRAKKVTDDCRSQQIAYAKAGIADQILIKYRACCISGNIVFVQFKDSDRSFAAVAVGTEAGSAVIAENKSLIGSADEIVDMVMGKERTDDIALFKPCFILTRHMGKRLRTRSFAQNTVVGNKLFAVKPVPLVVIKAEYGSVALFGACLVDKLIDFLDGNVLKKKELAQMKYFLLIQNNLKMSRKHLS